MHLVRMLHEGAVRHGFASEDSVKLLAGDPFSSWELDDVMPFEHSRLLAPVAPSKVVCVGVNYREHCAEMGHELPDEPVIFLKPPTSVIGPGMDIRIPAGFECVDYEAELGVIIGRRTHAITPEMARDHILGYTCGNDVTNRIVQRKDGQWTRAKGYDTFCPLGPWIEAEIDPMGLRIESYVNGELRQSASTSDMIFNPFELVSFISRVMTLLPGDVVLTGTPAGIGPMKHGDTVEVRIENVGSLVNTVVRSGDGDLPSCG